MSGRPDGAKIEEVFLSPEAPLKPAVQIDAVFFIEIITVRNNDALEQKVGTDNLTERRVSDGKNKEKSTVSTE